MATKVPPLPSAQAPVADPKTGAMNDVWYRQLKTLEQVVREQAAHIETLRTALNETRQNPTTVYSVIPPF